MIDKSFISLDEFERLQARMPQPVAASVRGSAPVEDNPVITYVLYNPDADGADFVTSVRCNGKEYELEVERGRVRTQIKELAEQLERCGLILLEIIKEDEEE